jgi:hypothetical protein
MDCHHFKDRVPLDGWSMAAVASAMAAGAQRPVLELLAAAGNALPAKYRDRLQLDDLGFTIRPLQLWSEAELSDAVRAATSTEGRVYLAKAVALAFDARAMAASASC